MMQSLFPCSSDYSRLPSSPTKKPLLQHDSLNEFNRYEQYETTIKDLISKNRANEEKITELERKTERLDDLLFSKTTVMERNVRVNDTNVKRITELEQKMERLSQRLSKKTEGSQSDSTIATDEKVIEIEQKIGRLEKLLHSKSAAMEGTITRLERLLVSNTVATDGSISVLRTKVDELGLPPLSPNGTNEEREHEDEPEYVNRIMGAIMMLVFVLSIFIGIRL